MTSLPVSEELRLHQYEKKREFDPENYPILLAEDNPDDILITQKAWEAGKIKNKLYVVKNGKEALDFLYKKEKFADAPTPGLMLLDLKMPLVDGFEVLVQIKEDS